MRTPLGAAIALVWLLMGSSTLQASPASMVVADPPLPVDGGSWQRSLPPGSTEDFATAFDEHRGVWLLAGVRGSAWHGEIWTTPRSHAAWQKAEAANRVPPNLTPVFTAWDAAGDRLISLLTEEGYGPRALVLWECDRGDGDVWRPIATEGSVPARQRPVVTFDPASRRLFLFGGYGDDDGLQDVWVLSLAPTPRWTRLETVGAKPLARSQGGIAFEPDRQLLILYGGEIQLGGGTVRADGEDVWFLDLAVSPPTWRQVAETSPGPQGRLRSQLIVDSPNARILTFGGTFHQSGIWEMSLSSPGTWQQAGSGFPRVIVAAMAREPDSSAVVMLTESRELWRLDLVKHSVQLIDPGSQLFPQTGDAALALDPRDGSVLSMGAAVRYDSTGQMHVAHRLARYVPGPLARWDSVTAVGDPPARSGGSAVWDARRRRWVVLGGGVAGTRLRAEPWVLDIEPGLAWRALPTAGIGPVGIHLPAVYDRERDRILVLEEDPATRGTVRDEDSRLRVWSLRLDGQPRWTLETTEGRSPTGRDAAALALDQRRDRLLLFGGRRWVEFALSISDRDYSDVWALSLSGAPAWRALVPMPNPLPRSLDAGADVDPWSDRLRLIGGLPANSPFRRRFDRDSLRTLSLQTNTLDPVVPPSGFQEVGYGRTILDPVAGRAIHLGFRSAYEWTTVPRIDARLTLSRGDRPEEGGRLHGKYSLEVVVHGADRFDPSTIEFETVRIAGTLPAVASPGRQSGRETDVDGDGFADRRFLFVGRDLPIDERVELRALTSSGVRVIGFGRHRAPGDRRGVGPSFSPDAIHPLDPIPLTARILHGAVARLAVEGGTAGNVSVDMYDVRGRRLWSARRERDGLGTLTIDLPASVSTTPGIRFVRVRAGDEVRVLRHVTLD